MILEEAEREKSAAIRNKLIAELGGDPNDDNSVSSIASKSIHVEDIMKEFDTFGDKSKSTIYIQSKRDNKTYKTVKPDYDSAAGDELPEPSESESIRHSDKIGGLLYDNKVRKPTKKKRKAAVSKSRSKSNNRSKKPEESKSQSIKHDQHETTDVGSGSSKRNQFTTRPTKHDLLNDEER